MHNNANLRLPALCYAAITCLLLLASCYVGKRPTPVPMSSLSPSQIDSLRFATTHHYSENYNFVVISDSLRLFLQQPEEFLSGLTVDSFFVKKDVPLVVADVVVLPPSMPMQADSVWVQVATAESVFGWTTERELLPNVSPDDPISIFINTFSNSHLLVFIMVLILGISVYIIRLLSRRQAHLVHLRDIPSFYPTLLAIIVATAATFYTSILHFAPEAWKHFYFHPTLNPLSAPLLIGIFLALVWSMLIVALAAIDEVRHLLPFGAAFSYLAGLAGVCAIDYIVFRITTRYYIGYVLLAVYIVYAIWTYLVHARPRVRCGRCGTELRSHGRCPNCGAINEA